MKIILLLLFFSNLAFGSDLTYTKDAKPIFQNRCAMCHNENWTDHNWLDYNNAFKYKDKIKEKVNSKEMPPGNQTNMTDSERDTIVKWIDTGAKK